MAALTTPTVASLAFATASRVDGNATYFTSAANNSDITQLRVRWVRHRTSSAAPTAATVRGLVERTGGFANFTSAGRTYQYKDETITGGLDGNVPISEASLSGYNVWAMVRLEV